MNEQTADLSTAPKDTGQSVDELASTLQEAQAKADDYWNQLLRLRAEMENQRRRQEREMENAHKYALERFAQDLLPVKDSLEMGLAAAGQEGADLAKICEGMEMTNRLLEQSLARFGIKETNPHGQRFNPDQHQAMGTLETTETEPQTVTLVYQKGYLLNERVLRPALVQVAKAPAA